MALKLEKENYSASEIQELFKPFEEEVSSLKSIVVEGNKAIEQVKTLEKTNLANTIKLEMNKAGIDESLFDLVDAPDVKAAELKINKLLEMRKNDKISTGYKPDEHKQNTEYEKMEKEGNVQGMLQNKFKKLFA